MNTRQKLTLGIAAIFMVTLTIVGVTYAYFVTQITDGGTDETITVVKSANIGASYSDNEQNVVLNDALPGTSVYKAWAVTNTGDAETAVALNLKTTATVGSEFIHSSLPNAVTEGDANDVFDTCYVASATQSTTNCFDKTGKEAYNNIYVSLVEVAADDAGNSAAAFFAKTNLEELYNGGDEIQTEIAAPYTGTTINLGTGLQDVGIGANAVNYYILKVEYKSVDANQNIENLATVNIIPSISSTMEPTA